MESQQVLESFDSLWFFATVFPNGTPPPPPAVEKLEIPTQNVAVEPPGEEIATPIFQNQLNAEPNIKVEKTTEDGGGLGSEVRTEEKEDKRRSCWSQRRKIVGKVDLSHVVKESYECWLFEERIGNGRPCRRKKKMSAIEDSKAMKEHIRSWAYAVACTVR